MCTDGILEQVTNEVLENTLNGKITPQDGIKVLSNYCEGKTKDNYSAYLIQVAEEDVAFSMEAVGKENFKWVKVALAVVVVIILWLLGSKFFNKQALKTDIQTKPKIELPILKKETNTSLQKILLSNT
jgi:hypothetical protein